MHNVNKLTAFLDIYHFIHKNSYRVYFEKS